MSTKPAALIVAFLILFISGLSYGKTAGISIAPNITLQKDSIITQIITALNGLRAQLENPDKQNEFILPAELLTTSALVDEMKGQEQNSLLHDKNFYKPYITNIVKQRTDYLVQVSYIGITDGAPTIKASFKLLAKQQGEKFLFYSPLKQNTTGWRSKTLGYITYWFKAVQLIT